MKSPYITESGTQLINMLTMKPLNVDSNVEWNIIDKGDGDFKLENTFTDLNIDCAGARTAGKPCSTMKKKSKPTQFFYNIDLS